MANVASFTACPENAKNTTYLADPYDCGAFFECSNSVPLRFTCPEGTYFDTERTGCSWAENVDCGVRPTTPTPTTAEPTTVDSADV